MNKSNLKVEQSSYIGNTSSGEQPAINSAANNEIRSPETDRANGKRRESFLSTLMRVMSSVSF
jgi:hypothetical protein